MKIKINPLYTIAVLTLLYAGLAIFTYTTHARAEVTVAPATAPAITEYSNVTHTELEKEKQRTLTKLAGAKVVNDAATTQFNQLTDAINQEIATDDSLLALKEARDIRQARLKLLEQNNNGSPDEIHSTMLAIDEIRMDIANRIEAIRGRSHAAIYFEVAKANLTASLELKEAQAQLDSIQARLNQLQ